MWNSILRGDVADARLARLAGGEVVGLLGSLRDCPVRAVAGEKPGMRIFEFPVSPTECSRPHTRRLPGLPWR